MSPGAIATGCVLHWEGFKFPDGTAKDKYFVVVGAQPGQNYLAVITTSVAKNKSFEAGGTPKMATIISPGAVAIISRKTPGCSSKNRKS
jgi:hypothetical protein